MLMIVGLIAVASSGALVIEVATLNAMIGATFLAFTGATGFIVGALKIS